MVIEVRVCDLLRLFNRKIITWPVARVIYVLLLFIVISSFVSNLIRFPHIIFKVGLTCYPNPIINGPAALGLFLGTGEWMIIYMTKDCFKCRNIISPSSRRQVEDWSNTPKHLSSIGVFSGQAALSEYTSQYPLDFHICLFNRPLILRASWPTCHSNDVWIQLPKKLKN